MQHQATPASPLTTPQTLHRETGTHDILVELGLADLVGLLFALLLGALFGALLVPPVRWLLLVCLTILHASLLLDIAALVIVCCLANAVLHEWVMHKEANTAWGCTFVLFLGVLVASLILFFVKRSWLTIPSPVFPPVILSPPSWSPPPSPSGLAVAASLYLLAHIRLGQHVRSETIEQLHAFSRAHQDGRLCRLLEHVYDSYRQGLARFDPPPVERLKTPPMCYFFPRRPLEAGEDELDALAHPEREIYLVEHELVICQVHLSTQPEQLAVLMPLVARLLHDYNSPTIWVERFLRMAELARASALYSLLLPIPLIVARSCERRWQAVERERVLDRDHFAWQCGEGGRLQKLLANQLAYLHRANKPDNTLPTLAERIDHLESLRSIESRQLKELRAMLPPAPTRPPTAPS